MDKNSAIRALFKGCLSCLTNCRRQVCNHQFTTYFTKNILFRKLSSKCQIHARGKVGDYIIFISIRKRQVTVEGIFYVELSNLEIDSGEK